MTTAELPAPRTLPAAVIPLFRAASSRLGLDADTLLAAPDPWVAAEQAAQDPDIGLHLADAIEESAINPLVYLAMSCATLGEGLDRLVRFAPILGNSGRLGLHQGPREVGLTFESLPPRVPERHYAEFVAVALGRLCRWITGRDVPLLSARFEHPAPASTVEHRRLLCEDVRFGVARPAGIVLATEQLELPSRHAAPELQRLHEEFARRQLEGADDLIPSATRAIAQGMSAGRLDVEAVARSLGMSARTLQRRLSQLGTNYKGLVDSVRRQAALRLLEREDLSVQEVATRAGFADYSAFFRAFKRWTGASPRDYRRR